MSSLPGKIRGAVGIVGCNNPHVKHDYGHVTLSKALIKKNILCVETGCAAIASGKAGLLMPSAAALAGDDLRAVCESLKIPPVLHMGSCVDNSRILVLAAELGNALNVPIHKLPIAGAAPEWSIAEGGLDRHLLRCVGRLYRARRDAAYLRQPGRGLAPDRRPQGCGERKLCR